MGPEAERILHVGTAALQPPRGAKQRGWRALQQRIEPRARPRWVVPLAAAVALAAAIVLLWSLASSRVVVADGRDAQQAIDQAVGKIEPRAIDVAAPAVSVEPIVVSPTTGTPTPAPPSRPRADPRPAVHTDDPLAAAAATLRAARTALDVGKPEIALTHARAHEQQFPDGVLAEDAAALEIEALCRLGRAEDAGEAAVEMQRRFPDSTIADRLVETSCPK